MEEKQIINKLLELKEIKPRKEWVFSLKSEILANSQPRVFDNKVNYKKVFSNIFKMPFAKMAYSFAVLLFVLLGGVSFMQYASQNSQSPVVANNSSIVPLTDPVVKDNMEAFKMKSRNLAEVAKAKPQDMQLALKEVKDAAKNLTDAIQKNPESIKAVALDINNNKTYLDVQGADDLKETSEVLYKTIDEQMIKDLENTTLTESHQETMEIIKNLYEEKKYTSALESILLLNAAMLNINQ